jgi:hypothetical protein
MMDESLIVAFRTHIWDEHIELMARRLYAASIGARFVVVADETKGVLDTAPFEKISHTDDFSSFDLPHFPAGQVLWYNADYPLYVLRRAFPNAACYAMVEYDVSVTADLTAMMRHAVEGHIDLIAHEVRDAPHDWYWYNWIKDHFARPMQSLIPLLVLSGRAIDHMLRARQDMAKRMPPSENAHWPFCEAFIPSVLLALPDFRMEDIRDHAKLPHYSFSDARSIADPIVNQPGSIVHPVLGGGRFIDKRVLFEDITAVFDAESPLRRQLSFADPADFIDRLTLAVRRRKSPEMTERFNDLATLLGWRSQGLKPSIAMGKPALVSSVCQWSYFQDAAQEASGGNNGEIVGDFGFHTDHQTDPWWQVDLQDNYLVESVILYNRLDYRERCTRVAVLASMDGQDWHLQGAKIDDALFGGADGHPYVFKFGTPFIARYVRIAMIGEGMLHLDQIEIFGTPQTP